MLDVATEFQVYNPVVFKARLKAQAQDLFRIREHPILKPELKHELLEKVCAILEILSVTRQR